MPEPRLEEGETSEDNKQEKATKKGSNPLASLMSKKVKIFGREIPMPLIILGALGIGIVIFTLIGKKGGGNSESEPQEETNDFGFSSSPENLGEFAQGSANTSIDEMQSDLGSVLPIEPLPVDQFTPSPLPSFDVTPLPQLPYSNFSDFGFQSDQPFLGGNPEYGLNQPVIQNIPPTQPIQTPSIPSVRSKVTASQLTATPFRSPPKNVTRPNTQRVSTARALANKQIADSKKAAQKQIEANKNRLKIQGRSNTGSPPKTPTRVSYKTIVRPPVTPKPPAWKPPIRRPIQFPKARPINPGKKNVR